MVAKTIDHVWPDFWAWTQAHPAGAYLFRGQPDDSPIRPKIGRPAYGFDLSRERALFAAFERAVRPFLVGELSPIELLALAQHHGAPTRLVDWSTTPLVAGYFAVSSYPDDRDAQVYALDVSRSDLETIDARSGVTSGGWRVENLLDLRKGVYLIETAQVSNRISAQRGVFTLHADSTTALAIDLAQTFVIPASVRVDFQTRLMNVGIDAGHIIPTSTACVLASTGDSSSVGAVSLRLGAAMKTRVGLGPKAAAHIVGMKPSGIMAGVEREIEREVKAAFRRNGKAVVLRGMRFIPSTKVDLGDGMFQVMANTVVNIAGRGRMPSRAQAFDAVVTIGTKASAGQTVAKLKIPALEARLA